MKLYEAMAYAIGGEGLQVICSRRLLNYIVDLQACETPALKHVVATIVNEGYYDRLYEGLVAGFHQTAFSNVSYYCCPLKLESS